MQRKFFFPLVLLLPVLACCTLKNKPASNINFEITETYQSEEMLPLLAEIDLLSDSLTAAAYVKTQKALVESTSDTVRIDIDKYLRSYQRSALFQRLEPNRSQYHNAHDPFNKSSMLGFSSNKDTSGVNGILAHSSLVDKYVVFQWVPYTYEGDESYSALVALKPSSHVITLQAENIKDIKVEQTGSSNFWKLVDKIRGKDEYALSMTFDNDSLGKIKALFPEDTSVLIRYRRKGKEVFCSSTSRRLIKGAVIGYQFRRKDL
ncbi:MAG: hypothetical protein JWO06_349 [Bacteroidota bacterium]|nr:hypothetical protein [Bacteroidota bacterium]